MIPVLAGIFLAALLFAALLFSAGRAMAAKGARRWLHVATAAGILLGIGSVTLVAPGAAQLVGLLLVPLALALILMERGGNRVLPVAPLLLGLALIAGLPFGGV